MTSAQHHDRTAVEQGGPDIAALLPDVEVLLVVPPLATLDAPRLGVHMLQACARQAGFDVGILYANLAFAAWIGHTAYTSLTRSPATFLGERIFAHDAYGVDPVPHVSDEELADLRLSRMMATSGLPNARALATAMRHMRQRQGRLSADALKDIECQVPAWCESVSTAIAQHAYAVVGATTMFDQTAAGIALLNRVKALRPETVTILGGANCEGVMAEGILSLPGRVDHIFSGESERTLPRFLAAVRRGERNLPRIIRGEPIPDLEALPLPDPSSFYEQRKRLLPRADMEGSAPLVTYESSRGCWWAQRHPCRFCGIAGHRLAYRAKSPATVVRELKAILKRTPTRRILMVDNVAPKDRLPELMDRLAEELPGLDIRYELRTGISLREMLALRRGGVTLAQPGLETLSDALLETMGKGRSLRNNIAFLRYALVAGVRVFWNLLWAVPADTEQEYEEMIRLMPYLYHLPAPSLAYPIFVARFSPYFEDAPEYGITNLRPWNRFEDYLPAGADAFKLDYRFAADYECAAFANVDLVLRFYQAHRRWRAYWEGGAAAAYGRVPKLSIDCEGGDRFKLTDTRGLPHTRPVRLLDHHRAEYALVTKLADGTPEAEWAVANGLAIVRGRQLIPLATASPDLLLAFEREMHDGPGEVGTA